MIEERLSTVWGADWTTELQTKHKGVTRMLADAQPKQEADERRFGRSASWLAYTYPGDLAEIVLRFWDTFSVVFQGGDKQFWKARLDAIATYRTPMAHNRAEVLGVNERLQCRMYAEQFFAQSPHTMRRSCLLAGSGSAGGRPAAADIIAILVPGEGPADRAIARNATVLEVGA